MSHDLDSLGILASSVVGRTLRVSLQQAARKLPTYTDGSIIHLDSLDADARSKVLIQAALLGAGSLAPQTLRQLPQRQAIVTRYLQLEGYRAVAALRQRLPQRLLAHSLFRDSRPASGSAAQSLAVALGQEPLPATPHLFGSMRPRAVLGNADVQELLAPTAQQLRGEFRTVAVEALDPDEDSEEIAFFKYLSNPLTSGNKIADLLKDILGLGSQPRGRKSGDGGGGDLPVGRTELHRRRSKAALQLQISPPPLQALTGPPVTGIKYPEWDVGLGSYRPDWVTVSEMEPFNPEHGGESAAGTSGSGVALRRQIAALGLNHEQRRHQPSGDSLEIDPLIKLAVDLRKGGEGDARIYSAPRKTRRDLGILLLVDASGSTQEPGSEGSRGRRIHDQQMDAVFLLSQELHRLGDRTAIYAFNSWGRNLVRMLRIKSFQERSIVSVRQRIEHIVPDGYTRMGGAIRHAAAILEGQSGTPYKLLLLVSDGFCYDHDYEGRLAEADTARALRELRDRGIAPLCMSIGSGIGDSALRRVFGAHAHIGAESFENVVPHLRRLLRATILHSHRRHTGGPGGLNEAAQNAARTAAERGRQ